MTTIDEPRPPFEEPEEEPPQAMCLRCGGKLELLTVDETNKIPYRCRRCGAEPSPVNSPPRQSRLARSYIPKLGKAIP